VKKKDRIAEADQVTALRAEVHRLRRDVENYRVRLDMMEHTLRQRPTWGYQEPVPWWDRAQPPITCSVETAADGQPMIVAR
jgi:hypothetical protein